jgi:cyclopropane-fatty-acyl-phospholipid synthase
MIEAVGHAWFDTYFETCSRLLRPDGLMLLQAITIDDRRYAAAKRSVDFIQRYIFPGGSLPSVAVIGAAVARNTDMRIAQLEDIGPHYATTLKHWRERFLARLDAVRALGYPEAFIRMWEYYLCYCEGGFRERALGTVQALLAKPLNRHEVPLLPLPATA